MRHIFASIILAGLPTFALADCPTAADLGGGVRFDLTTGGSWDIRAAGGQDRQVTLVWDPQYETQSLVYDQGIYLSVLAIPSLNSTSLIRFNPPLDTAPDPAPGVQWEVTIDTVTDGINRRDRVRLIWGAPKVVRFGACTYDSLPLQWTTVHEDGTSQVHAYSYLMEFGAVIMNGEGFGTTWTVTGVSAL